MGKVIDLRGQTFGRLTVMAQANAPASVRSAKGLSWAFWLCECHEGNRVVVRGQSLRDGHTKSCGCLKGVQLAKARAAPRKSRVVEQSGFAPQVNGHAAFNQGIAWAMKQLLAADHQDAADTLSRAADVLLASRAPPDVGLFGTITRVADDGRAVVVRG